MPDSLELPQGVQRLNNVSSLFIKSKFIEKELKKHRIRTIKKSFPEFSQSDTTFAIFEGRVVKQMDKSRIFSLSFYSDEEAKEAMQKLNELSGVLFAEPDYSELKPSIESFSITNDNMVSEQWHLNNTGQPDGTAGADISAFDAWNIFEGINENKIAIIGRGVDGNHPDLLGKVSGDGPDPNHLTLPGQVAYYHETGVAGMASAKIGGGSLRGIDSNAGIISKRIFNGLESGCSTFTPENCNAISIGFPAISNKINEAIIEGARTLNHSYSGPSNSNVLKEAFSNAYALNRVSVASMGNDGTSQIQYPAGYENYVIAVGNSDKFDNLSSSSNTGNHIDVVAPGTNVLTTWAENDLGHLRIVNGNSFSAPLVSGLANFLFGHSNNYIPNIANDDIKNLIRISADEVDNVPGFDNQFGYGRINAFQALKKLEPPYELLHFSSNSGGNIYSTSGFYYLKMLGVNGLADGTYRVKRIEVRKSVHFSYMDEVNVWGRGAFSVGFSDEDPNFGTGWVEPVSFSNSSATLRTYIYEVRHLIYNYLVGHFPTTANNVQFAYTVHGIPSTPPFSANISGPSYVSAPSSHTFTANGNSGVTPYTSYTWYRRPFNGSNWTQFSNNSSVNVMFSSFDSPGVEFKVAIQDSDNNIAEAVKLVHFTDDGGGCTDPTQPCLSGNASSDIPSEFNISQNFPNPFNPVTQIEFGVPENSAVTLKVHNIMGQEVVTLVNENLNAGNHRAQFDATSLSSGIYIAKINAVGVTGLSFVKTIKMNLIKLKNFLINILFSLFLVLIINCSTNSDESDVSPSISPINYYHSLPVWSHDGNYIYYVMIPSGYFLPYTDEKTGIYRIKPDGTGKELLIELNRFSSSISRLDISSDNEWLVFDLNGQIHKYSTSTDSLVKLTFEGRNYFPSWKPDGTQIVYDSNLDSDSHYFLWTIDASGLNNKRIIYTPELGSVRMPYWGEFIYHKRRNDIYRMDEKGLNVRQITFNDSDERDIKYNSTSESLVFTISASVWTADKEGKNQKQLTDNLEGMYPSWSPDGEQIVNTYPVPQNGYLWIMDKDGKNRRQLTD